MVVVADPLLQAQMVLLAEQVVEVEILVVMVETLLAVQAEAAEAVMGLFLVACRA